MNLNIIHDILQKYPVGDEVGLRNALNKLITENESSSDTVNKQGSDIIVELTAHLLDATDENDIYDYIGKALHEVVPDSIVILNINDSETGKMSIRNIYTPEESNLLNVFRILGYNPVGKSYKQKKEAMKVFASGQLTEFPGGLVSLGGNYVPDALIRQIIQMLNLKEVFLIGFSRETEIFAGAQIYTLQNSAAPDKELIETMVTNASIALQKFQYKSFAEEKANELSNFLGHLPVGVVFVDEKEKIVEWNKEMEKITGYTKYEVFRNNYLDFSNQINKNPKEHKENSLIELFKNATEEEKILQEEKYFLHKDGATRFVIEKSYLFTGRSQKYAVILFMDITEHQKISDELKEAGFALEQKNRILENTNEAKNKLISIIGHDLRGPLGNILGLTELLVTRDYSSLGKMRNFHKLLFITAESSYLLLENILAWLRSENKGLDLNLESFPLNEVIVQTQRLLQLVAEQKQITFRLELPDDLIVFADRNMLTTVFRNLLSNAVKFTSQNGHIKVLVKPKNEKKILISILDDGKGLTKTEVFSIKNLRRDSTPGTAGERGTGLGLIICQEFIKLHGSELCIDSLPGKGSKFSFELPRVKL